MEIVPDLMTAPALAPRPLTAEVEVGQKEGDATRFDLARSPAAEWPAAPKSLARPGREKELTRFRAVAGQVATLAVRPEPRGWFELADADDDGQLFVRELRSFWRKVSPGGGPVRRRDLADPPPTYSLDYAPGTATRPPVRSKKAPQPGRGPRLVPGARPQRRRRRVAARVRRNRASTRAVEA